MVYVHLVYGIVIKQKDIRKAFPITNSPDVIEPTVESVVQHIKINEGVRILHVDFEHYVTTTKEGKGSEEDEKAESAENDGDANHLLIGVTYKTLGAHYSGSMIVDPVPAWVQKILNEFLLANSNLQIFSPQQHIYLDTER